MPLLYNTKYYISQRSGTGGPGTGKSVLAINVLARYIIDFKLNASYITKNMVPRKCCANLLAKGSTKKMINLQKAIQSPWSFMYSDDIWNLVLTSKSNNSSKSNSIPSEEVIERLKERNSSLVGILDPKFDMEIRESIDKGLIDKFYFECRM